MKGKALTSFGCDIACHCSQKCRSVGNEPTDDDAAAATNDDEPADAANATDAADATNATDATNAANANGYGYGYGATTDANGRKALATGQLMFGPHFLVFVDVFYFWLVLVGRYRRFCFAFVLFSLLSCFCRLCIVFQLKTNPCFIHRLSLSQQVARPEQQERFATSFLSINTRPDVIHIPDDNVPSIYI